MAMYNIIWSRSFFKFVNFCPKNVGIPQTAFPCGGFGSGFVSASSASAFGSASTLAGLSQEQMNNLITCLRYVALRSDTRIQLFLWNPKDSREGIPAPIRESTTSRAPTVVTPPLVCSINPQAFDAKIQIYGWFQTVPFGASPSRDVVGSYSSSINRQAVSHSPTKAKRWSPPSNETHF